MELRFVAIAMDLLLSEQCKKRVKLCPQQAVEAWRFATFWGSQMAAR
jgi:hypothetical protein